MKQYKVVFYHQFNLLSFNEGDLVLFYDISHEGQHHFPGGEMCLALITSPITSLELNINHPHFFMISLTLITFKINTISCYSGSYFATVAVLNDRQRPLNLIGHQCLWAIDTLHYCPFISLKLVSTIIGAPKGDAYINFINCF